MKRIYNIYTHCVDVSYENKETGRVTIPAEYVTGSVSIKGNSTTVERVEATTEEEFVEALKDITLVFRGSSNQRVIDVQKSLREGQLCLYPVKK